MLVISRSTPEVSKLLGLDITSLPWHFWKRRSRDLQDWKRRCVLRQRLSNARDQWNHGRQGKLALGWRGSSSQAKESGQYDDLGKRHFQYVLSQKRGRERVGMSKFEGCGRRYLYYYALAFPELQDATFTLSEDHISRRSTWTITSYNALPLWPTHTDAGITRLGIDE